MTSRVAVIDQSRTPESRRLIDAFDGNPTFRVTHVLQDPKDLDRLLLRREVDIGLQIPPDFSARIRRGETAEVQILVDGSMSNMAAVRIAYSVNVLDAFNAQLLRELNRRRIDYGEIDGRIRTWYNPNLDSQNFYVPGIVAFLVMLLSLLVHLHGRGAGEGSRHHGAADRDPAHGRPSSSSARPSPSFSSPRPRW